MNLLSIVLGTVSLAFAVHAFQVRGCLICCTGSLVSCGLSLLCQLGELYRLVCIGDMAAVYDTGPCQVSGGVCTAGPDCRAAPVGADPRKETKLRNLLR